MASAQVELNDQLQNGTSIGLNNQTVASMQYIRSHSWSGHFKSPPVNIISQGTPVIFDHLKGYDQGSKAALSYTITSPTGAPMAVIQAWSAPANFNPSTSPNKVYAACGPRSLIDSMTWDQIQEQLDKAGSDTELNVDGVYVRTIIFNNPTTKMADLRATFASTPRP